MMDWSAVNKSVHELEASQKIVLKMIRKVQCYINALHAADVADKNSMPTQDTITACSNLGQTSSIDTSALDIDYTTPDAKITCDKNAVAHKPGSGNFKSTEYSDTNRYNG